MKMMKLKILPIVVFGMMIFSVSCSDDDGIMAINTTPIILDQMFSINENESVGYSLGTIVAVDLDQDLQPQ